MYKIEDVRTTSSTDCEDSLVGNEEQDVVSVRLHHVDEAANGTGVGNSVDDATTVTDVQRRIAAARAIQNSRDGSSVIVSSTGSNCINSGDNATMVTDLQSQIAAARAIQNRRDGGDVVVSITSSNNISSIGSNNGNNTEAKSKYR